MADGRRGGRMLTAIRPRHFPWFDYSRYTFSLGVSIGPGTALLSGHTASEFDPESRRIVVRGGLDEQVRTAYAKIAAILEAAELGLDDVVRVVEYVRASAVDEYGQIEAARREILGTATPAVNTVCVNALLRPEAFLEIEVVAKRGGPDDPLNGIVYLPSLAAPEVGPDVASQAAAVVDRGRRLLEASGLTLSAITKAVYYVSAREDAEVAAGALANTFGGGLPPAVTVVVSPRLRDTRARVQVDLMASRHQLRTVTAEPRYPAIAHSAAVQAGRVLFLSGQAGVSVEAGLASAVGGVMAQAETAYHRLLTVLAAAGLGAEHLVKTIEYVTPDGLSEYRGVADVRSHHLREPYPAATGLVTAGLLGDGVQLEVDSLALFPDGA